MAKWDINFDYKVNVDEEILSCLVTAEAHRQITARIPIPPAFAERMDRLNIVRQIKGTTGLEGNPLSEDEIEKLIERSGERLAQSTSSESAYDREVQNAYEVQQFIRSESTKADGRITEELIRKLHFIGTKEIESGLNTPGQYRTSTVHAGEYSPPGPEKIPQLMAQFVEMVNERRLSEGLGAVIRAIVAHFFLVSIHPFGDGNGRTSRALEAYILYSSRFNARGFYSLANFFYKNREQYIRELQDARFQYDGNLTHFVKFSLGGLVQEIKDLQEEILSYIRILFFRSHVEEMFDRGEINARCAAFLTLLTQIPEGGIPLQQFVERKSPVIRGLYDGIKTEKTVHRDLRTMREKRLIYTDDRGVLRPNVALLDQFEG